MFLGDRRRSGDTIPPIRKYVCTVATQTMEGNAVLFTGLPRVPDIFRRSLIEIYELKQEDLVDDIIFVTWRGKLADSSELRKTLTDCDVTVIEAEESPIDGHGNIWHQMKALDIGLRYIPEGYTVLKSRSDVHIRQEFLRRLFTGKIDGLQNEARSPIFQRRVWVPWFVITNPFSMDDRCFFGLKQDLEKFVNFNAKYDVFDWHVRGITHVRRFIEPYRQQFPFLDGRFAFHRQNETPDSVFDIFEQRLSSGVFSQFLGFYYKTVLSDFYIHMDPVRFYKSTWEGPPRPVHQRPLSYLDDDLFAPNFRQEKALHIDDDWISKRQKNIYCYRSEWLRAHFSEPRSTDIPEPLTTAFDRSFQEWRTFSIPKSRIEGAVDEESRYWSEPPAGPHPVLGRVANALLEPLGLKTYAKSIYSLGKSIRTRKSE